MATIVMRISGVGNDEREIPVSITFEETENGDVILHEETMVLRSRYTCTDILVPTSRQKLVTKAKSLF